MGSQFDIRCIRLTKSFCSILSEDAPEANKELWHTFGWYDTMEVSKLDLDSEDSKTPFPPAFESIYNHATELSLLNPGNQKVQLIFGIGASERKNHEQFWKEAPGRPVLCVSLVHLRRTPADAADKSKASPGGIANDVKEIQTALDTSALSADAAYSIYYSLECNDLIIFWSAARYDSIMYLIAKLAACKQNLVGEVFTIQSCRQETLESVAKGEEPWNSAESVFHSIRVHLRHKNFGDLLKRTQALMEDVLNHHRGWSVEQYITPGQDDIILDFKDIPIQDFFRMYCDCPPPGEASVLDNFMSWSNMTTRTVMDISVKGTGCNPPETAAKADEKLMVLIREYCAAIKGIPSDARRETALSLWGIPLQELLVEFSCIASSSTYHDIFQQSIDCHERFVRQIIDLLEEGNSDLLMPTSLLVTRIQKYLRGWSQLSYHAMRAEWQLTHTSDFSRLYLFPAKLNRLYSMFMQQSGKMLGYTDIANPQASTEIGQFFLVPMTCTEATFESIFRSCGDEHTSKLVLGEIPADLIFSPHILLPALVHEAAHYAGHLRRQRELRYTLLLRSVLYFTLTNLLNLHYLMEDMGNGEMRLFRYIATLERQFAARDDPKDYYSDRARGVILSGMLQLISGIKNARRTRLFSPGVHDADWEKHPGETLFERKCRNEKHWRSDAETLLNEMCVFHTPFSLESYLSQLISVYQEMYADFCMVYVLGMSLPAYLNVVARMRRMTLKKAGETERNGSDGDVPVLADSDRRALREWYLYERYMVIVDSYADFSNDSERRIALLTAVANKTEQDDWKMVPTTDEDLVRALARELSAIEDEWIRSDTDTVYQSPFSRSMLAFYLQQVKQRWQDANGRSEARNEKEAIIQSGLRNVYELLSPAFGANSENIANMLQYCMKKEIWEPKQSA